MLGNGSFLRVSNSFRSVHSLTHICNYNYVHMSNNSTVLSPCTLLQLQLLNMVPSAVKDDDPAHDPVREMMKNLVDACCRVLLDTPCIGLLVEQVRGVSATDVTSCWMTVCVSLRMTC